MKIIYSKFYATLVTGYIFIVLNLGRYDLYFFL